MKNTLTALICTLLILLVNSLRAQEEKIITEIEKEREYEGAALEFGADIFSRYIWRGIDLGNSAAVQPDIAFSWKGLNIGAWGSYAFSKYSIVVDDTTIIDAGHYAEMDLYVSYTYKWFTLLFFDYFVTNGLDPNDGNRYFDYCNKTTGHTFEGSLIFDGPESFPLQFSVNTLFYGADKNKDSTGVYGLGDKNNFSTYIELAYTWQIRKIDVELKPFIGGIPFGSSWYGPYAGITNIGLLAKKEIPITSGYSLPVQVSLITNPQKQSVFLVFGLSF